jgi:hypothetical protein
MQLTIRDPDVTEDIADALKARDDEAALAWWHENVFGVSGEVYTVPQEHREPIKAALAGIPEFRIDVYEEPKRKPRPPTMCAWRRCKAERPADAEKDYDGWVWLMPSTFDRFGIEGLCPKHAAMLEAKLEPADEPRWTPVEEEE